MSAAVPVNIELQGLPALAVSGCRDGCAACCIAPSISTAMPKMPHGKPAGVPCAHLDQQLRCELFGLPQRPAVCRQLRPQPSMCLGNRDEALAELSRLEAATAP